MFEVSYGTAAALAGFIATVGPGFFFIGWTARQVNRNTTDIKVIFEKLDDIHRYVKENGG